MGEKTTQLDPDIQATALRLLARREHSRYELMQKLLIRDFEASAILPVLTYFAKKNWQSDERFAESYVRSCLSKGYGPLKIQAGLRERDVAPSIIADVLPKDIDFWVEHIHKVWQKKFNMVSRERGRLARKGQPQVAVTMKQQRFLQSRGFTGEIIKKLWVLVYEK